MFIVSFSFGLNAGKYGPKKSKYGHFLRFINHRKKDGNDILTVKFPNINFCF